MPTAGKPSDQDRAVNRPSGFLKNNRGKLRYTLIPPDALAELAKVYTYGADKYAAHNWLKGADRADYADALMRHYIAYVSGEIRDKDTGLHHMAHLAFSAFTLMAYDMRKIGENTLVYPPSIPETAYDGPAKTDPSGARDPDRT